MAIPYISIAINFDSVYFQLYIVNSINPLLPIAHKMARFAKISTLKLEGTIKNIS